MQAGLRAGGMTLPGCPRSFLLIMECLLDNCRRLLQIAGMQELPAAHQAGNALEQRDQGVTEYCHHNQHHDDQSSQDGAELCGALPFLRLVEEGDRDRLEQFLEHAFLQVEN
jgi:hypothetical protein